MYLNFYQLQRKPFSLAPDPEFLYLSQQHKDALGAIIYGIREKQGFVSVVGEVGTGKTTVVRSYLRKSERNKIWPVFIFNSRISFAELMDTFLHEIGINNVSADTHTVNEMVKLAYHAMLEQNKKGHTIVLIIDEAQNMPTETLAKLCILSNFETAKSKLIQIVLIGQPELQNKLNLHELRQLRQRIAYRAMITPLSTDDSVKYLHHRLSLSAKDYKDRAPVFSKSAINRIVNYSNGIPRVINILCENSLVAGYGLQKKPVTLKIVKQVIAEYEGKNISSPLRHAKVFGRVLALSLVGCLFFLFFPLSQSRENSPHSENQLAVSTSGQLPQPETRVKPTGNDNPNDMVEPVFAEAPQNTKPQGGSDITAAGEPGSNSDDLEELYSRVRSWNSFALLHLPMQDDNNLRNEDMPALHKKVMAVTAVPESHGYSSKHLPYLKIVQKGDTVSSLCLSIYGFVNSQLLDWIKGHNPHIFDLDQIRINEIIFFPDMQATNSFAGANRDIRPVKTTREEIVSR